MNVGDEYLPTDDLVAVHTFSISVVSARVVPLDDRAEFFTAKE